MRGLKITELGELTALTGEEWFVVVSEATGVPINKKVMLVSEEGDSPLADVLPIEGQIMFTVPGTLSVGDDQAPWFICGVSSGLTLVETALAVKTAPSGSSISVDIALSGNCGGSWGSIYSTKPSIPGGSRCGGGGTFSTAYISKGTILRLDIDSVGSGTAGADITVSLRVKQVAGATTSTSTTTLTSSSTSTTTGTSTSTTTISTSTTTGTTTTTLAWQSPVAVHSSCGWFTDLIPAHLIDGDVYTVWYHNVNEAHWIILNLGETKYVSKVRLFVSSHPTSQWRYCEIFLSDDPTSFPSLPGGYATFMGGAYEGEWVEQSLAAAAPPELKTGQYLKIAAIDTTDVYNYIQGAEFWVYAS